MTYEDVRIALIEAASTQGVSTNSPAFTEAMGIVNVAEQDGYEPTIASEIAHGVLSRAAINQVA